MPSASLEVPMSPEGDEEDDEENEEVALGREVDPREGAYGNGRPR